MFRGRIPLAVLDRTREEKDREILELFMKLQAETQLAVRTIRRQSRFYVQLQAPASAKQVSEETIRAVLKRLEAARPLFEIEGNAPLELDVRIDDTWYTWDGSRLVAQ